MLKTSTDLGKSIRCSFKSVEVISPFHYQFGVAGEESTEPVSELIAGGELSGL